MGESGIIASASTASTAATAVAVGSSSSNSVTVEGKSLISTSTSTSSSQGSVPELGGKSNLNLKMRTPVYFLSHGGVSTIHFHYYLYPFSSYLPYITFTPMNNSSQFQNT